MGEITNSSKNNVLTFFLKCYLEDFFLFFLNYTFDFVSNECNVLQARVEKILSFPKGCGTC